MFTIEKARIESAAESKKNPAIGYRLMSEALGEDIDKPLRPKVRAFLGTDYQTHFFDNLDDFSGCVKKLYGNSRSITMQINRFAADEDRNSMMYDEYHPSSIIASQESKKRSTLHS